MPDYPTLQSPPVEEAVLTVSYIPLGAGEAVKASRSFIEKAKGYSSSGVVRRFESRISASGDEMTAESSAAEIESYQFRKDLSGKTVRVGLNSFSCHQMRPYSSWDDLEGEAKMQWENWIGAVDGDVVPQKVGVHYVNRLVLDSKSFRAEDYLSYPPPIIENIGVVNKFMTDLSYQFAGDGSSRVIQFMDWDRETRNSVIFLNTVSELPVSTTRSFSFDDFLPRLREQKNRLFFGSLTQKAISSYL